ncbi:MAG: hypothetical protein C0505_06190 [Leptothrix sp. (in: Bacteria)]|nr:hypothetical protein [Leptothrix sp. (in: b-proteobacteria)]
MAQSSPEPARGSAAPSWRGRRTRPAPAPPTAPAPRAPSAPAPARTATAPAPPAAPARTAAPRPLDGPAPRRWAVGSGERRRISPSSTRRAAPCAGSIRAAVATATASVAPAACSTAARCVAKPVLTMLIHAKMAASSTSRALTCEVTGRTLRHRRFCGSQCRCRGRVLLRAPRRLPPAAASHAGAAPATGAAPPGCHRPCTHPSGLQARRSAASPRCWQIRPAA